MKFPSFALFIVFLSIFIVACQPSTLAATATFSPTQTTVYPIVTSTLTPYPSSTPDSHIIVPENASQIVQLKQMSKGMADGVPLYSPDGRWLYQQATSGIYVYDTSSSYTRVSLLIHLQSIGNSVNEKTITFSPDGKTLALSNYDDPDLLLSPDGQKLPDLNFPPDFLKTAPRAREVKFSPDSTLIARSYNVYQQQGIWPFFVAVWRLNDSKFIGKFEGKTMEFSPDSHWLAVQSDVKSRSGLSAPIDDSHVYVYDLQTGEQVGDWLGERPIFLPDNSLVVESEGYTRVFDVKTHRAQRAFEGKYAAFSPDGEMVATFSFDQIKMYRASDGKFLRKLDGKLLSIDNAILRFTADGKTLVGYTLNQMCCGGADAGLALWRVEDGSLIANLKKPSPLFDLSPDGQALVIRYGLNDVEVLRTSDSSILANLGGFSQEITNLAFTPDGKQIITAYYQDLLLYEVDAGALSYPQIPDKDKYQPILLAASQNLNEFDLSIHPLPGHKQPDAIHSFDGKILAQSNNKTVKVWSDLAGGPQFSFSVDQMVTRLAFSPDSQILAVGLIDGSVELWSVNTEQKIYTIPRRANSNYDFVGGLAFSPDGKLLAIGLADGTLRLFGIN